MKIRNRTLDLILIVFAIVSIVGVFSGADEPIISFLRGSAIQPILYRLHTGDKIIFNLSIGFLVSLFFWLIVVRIPERRKRAVIRATLQRRYHEFKLDIIGIMLQCQHNSYDSDLPEQLTDYKQFREYFPTNSDQWYAFLNEMQNERVVLREVLAELTLLANEVSYVLNNVDIDDGRVHAFFKDLSVQVYKLRYSEVNTYDQVKALGGFVWCILARFNLVSGQMIEDIIGNMIRKI